CSVHVPTSRAPRSALPAKPLKRPRPPTARCAEYPVQARGKVQEGRIRQDMPVPAGRATLHRTHGTGGPTLAPRASDSGYVRPWQCPERRRFVQLGSERVVAQHALLHALVEHVTERAPVREQPPRLDAEVDRVAAGELLVVHGEPGA